MSTADADIRAANDAVEEVEVKAISSSIPLSNICNLCVPEFNDFKKRTEGELMLVRAELQCVRGGLDAYENVSRKRINELSGEVDQLKGRTNKVVDVLDEVNTDNRTFKRDTVETLGLITTTLFGALAFVGVWFVYYCTH